MSDFLTTVINKTPHPLTIVDKNGEVARWPKPTEEEKSVVPRVDSEECEMGVIAGRFADLDVKFGDILFYPENNGDGNIYVTSRVFIEACKKANMDVSHLRSPGKLLRDDEGKVVGAVGLAR